ncbi:MAG TPA: 16S rRNA (guanine(527)-N(7))-methyltransferase RsmG, partial [Micavibrio sp.]
MLPDVSRESFARETGLPDVSRESLDKLLHYHTLLQKWQRAVNIVSPATLAQAWSRHIVDSAQIGTVLGLGAADGEESELVELASPVCYAPALAGSAPELSRKRVLFDFGSGGGFPGLVLAMLYPELLDVHLVESDQKKCSFMAAVSRETNTRVSIHNVRIENLVTEAVPDIITARALADLSMLLDYAEPWGLRNPDLVLVL